MLVKYFITHYVPFSLIEPEIHKSTGWRPGVVCHEQIAKHTSVSDLEGVSGNSEGHAGN